MTNKNNFDEALTLALAEHMPIHPDHKRDAENIKKAVRQIVFDMVIGKNNSEFELAYHGRKYDVRVRNNLRDEQRKVVGE